METIYDIGQDVWAFVRPRDGGVELVYGEIVGKTVVYKSYKSSSGTIVDSPPDVEYKIAAKYENGIYSGNTYTVNSMWGKYVNPDKNLLDL